MAVHAKVALVLRLVVGVETVALEEVIVADIAVVVLFN